MSDQDLWQVKLSEGCVVDMTLDEVDTAFNAGRIQASTLVMPPGDMRWTTLGAAAGLEDEEAPYSIAPVAADVAPPSTYGFGSPPVPDFDVDLNSFEGNAGLPKKRNMGAIVAVVMTFVVLVAVGIGGGAYAARPNDVKAKIAEIKAKVAPGQQRAAAVAAPPPAAEPPPAVKAPEPAPEPKPEEAAPAPAPEPTVATTSIDSLPNAKAAATKKGAKAPVTKKRKK